MTDPFDRQLGACQDRLETVDASLLVLFPSPNLTYLTGFADRQNDTSCFSFRARETQRSSLHNCTQTSFARPVSKT